MNFLLKPIPIILDVVKYQESNPKSQLKKQKPMNNQISNAGSAFPRMHVSLYVSDIAKSVEFYSQFFGQEPAKVKPNYAKYVLEKPSLIISFVESKEKVQSNFGHLGFQVESLEDLNIKLGEAKKNNLVAREEV